MIEFVQIWPHDLTRDLSTNVCTFSIQHHKFSWVIHLCKCIFFKFLCWTLQQWVFLSEKFQLLVNLELLTIQITIEEYFYVVGAIRLAMLRGRNYFRRPAVVLIWYNILASFWNWYRQRIVVLLNVKIWNMLWKLWLVSLFQGKECCCTVK